MSEDRPQEWYGEAERILGHVFRDRDLLLTAFTHETWAEAFGGKSNERLEFLGDSVLQLAVTEELLERSDSDEGTLTEVRKQFVARPALEQAEHRAGLMPYLRYVGSESNVGGKTASNLFEAVIGALYLDGGMPAAKAFMKRYLSRTDTENYKTILQEYVQERQKNTPRYSTHEEAEGTFVCTVSALGQSEQGKGTSKKAAETMAARRLYDKLRKGIKS